MVDFRCERPGTSKYNATTIYDNTIEYNNSEDGRGRDVTATESREDFHAFGRRIRARSDNASGFMLQLVCPS